MEVKMSLGRRVVADFHSEADALGAYDAFNREVRQGLEPADTETVPLPAEVVSDKGIRVDKLLAKIGLVSSVTEATRKLKEGAVEVNQQRVTELHVPCSAEVLVIRVGKKWKRVRCG
jgi:tyrosyl-tRNA synthetase